MRKTTFIPLLAAMAAANAWADTAQDWIAAPAKPTTTYAGPVIQAKFGHPAPPASLMTPLWRLALDKVAEATNHKLQFKEYGGGTLLGARDGFKAVRGGVAEWATCYVQFEGSNFALSKVWEQPFVQPANPMVATRIAFELAPRYFAPEFARQGVMMAGAMQVRSTDLMSKRPVRRVEDLRGMRIIAQSLPAGAAEALGFTLVRIPYPEIHAALEHGLADGVLWSDFGFVPYRIYELAKYRTTLGLNGSSVNMCANLQWYGKLPPELQKTFSSLLEPWSQAAAKVTQVDYSSQTAERIYRENGVALITLPPEELQKMRALLQPTVDQWARELERQGLPARALLADIKRLDDKYGRMSEDELMKMAIESPAPPLAGPAK